MSRSAFSRNVFATVVALLTVPLPTISQTSAQAQRQEATPAKPVLSFEPNRDRSGGNYRSFELRSPRPEACRDACASDRRCQAFTYVKPGIQGRRAKCWLKRTAPRSVRNACCVSGAKSLIATSPLAPVNPTSPSVAVKGSTKLEICGEGKCDSEMTRDMWRPSLELEGAGPATVTLRWSTKASGVAGLRWEVSESASPGQAPLATGTDPYAAPPGRNRAFTISNPLLKTQGVAKLWVRADAIDDQGKVIETAEPVQLIRSGVTGGTRFGRSASFPSVEMLTFAEKIGVVPLTQLHYAGADVKLRFRHQGRRQTRTDPILFSIQDDSGLMRPRGPVKVPSLRPGATHVVTLHLDAVLPASRSQLMSTRYDLWRKKYDQSCGVDLRGIMDWRGDQSMTPMNPHAEKALLLHGWAYYPNATSSKLICDGKRCLDACQMAKNIRKELDGRVVGYAFVVGQYPRFGANGWARTFANGKPVPFTPTTKITVASVSKLVTALAAVRVLAKAGKTVNAKIGPYLPSDWKVSAYVKNLTFRRLLNQTSGIKNYGNGPQDYLALKALFTRPVNGRSTTQCTGPEVTALNDPINPNDLRWCYSNYNTGIMRLLLPRVAGFKEEPSLFVRSLVLGAQYVKLVQQHVFDPLGQKGVACRPPASPTHALAYTYPGSKAGYDWGDNTYRCGPEGWYLSIEDMARTLLHLSANDPKTFNLMYEGGLGLDVVQPTVIEKNGAWGTGDGRIISTSAAVFGPKSGPRAVGVLFMNSNISGGPSHGSSAWPVLQKAYNNALKRLP